MSELGEPVVDGSAFGKKQCDGLLLKLVGLFDRGHRISF
jgi:hypothetical protein